MTEATATAADADGWEFAIVEIMGHRRHAGRAREEERFGTKMVRIDIPIDGNAEANGWKTHYYSGASLFSYTLTDEATIVRMNKPYEPPSRVSLPAPANDADFSEPVGGEFDEVDDHG